MALVVAMADVPGPIPAIREYRELEQFLREDLGFCGCSSPTQAIELLRDALRCARDAQEGFNKPDSHARFTDSYQRLQSVLAFNEVPGLATWFLYLLDSRNLIEHASNVTVCWISPRGRELLNAIERCFPPPPETGPAEPLYGFESQEGAPRTGTE